MTDILKIALDRRAALHDEVARIDDFIRMADSLLRKHPAHDEEPEPAPRSQGLPREIHDAFREPPTILPREAGHEAGAGGMTPGVTRMNLMRRGPAAVNG